MEPLAVVIIGVSVFVISQYVLKLVLEPAVQVRRTIAEVSSTVLFRQSKIFGASFHEETAEQLFRLAARLRADVYAVLFYDVLARTRIFGLPSKDDTKRACHELHLLAYTAQDSSKEGRGRRATENHEALKELGRLLHTETMYTDRRE